MYGCEGGNYVSCDHKPVWMLIYNEGAAEKAVCDNHARLIRISRDADIHIGADYDDQLEFIPLWSADIQAERSVYTCVQCGGTPEWCTKIAEIPHCNKCVASKESGAQSVFILLWTADTVSEDDRNE